MRCSNLLRNWSFDVEERGGVAARGRFLDDLLQAQAQLPQLRGGEVLESCAQADLERRRASFQKATAQWGQ